MGSDSKLKWCQPFPSLAPTHCHIRIRDWLKLNIARAYLIGSAIHEPSHTSALTALCVGVLQPNRRHHAAGVAPRQLVSLGCVARSEIRSIYHRDSVATLTDTVTEASRE